jgi:hypothetical protein
MGDGVIAVDAEKRTLKTLLIKRLAPAEQKPAPTVMPL